MLFRYLLSALALSTLATCSEAGPFRRSRTTYQPTYQSSPAATPVVPSSIEYVSNYTPVASSSVIVGSETPAGVIVPVDGFAGDGLDEVNAKRASRGLRPFVRDESLVQAARACAQFRANHGLFGHTSNDFSFVPPGSSASSAGCAAYPASYGWMSCCVYDNYTYGGAAYVTGRDGKRYMHLFVR